MNDTSGPAPSPSEHSAAEVLESISDAFFALDRQWRFTYVNAAAERLLSRQRRELLGQSIWDAFPEARGSAFEAQYRRAVADNATVAFAEYYAPLDAWFEVRAYPTPQGLSVYFQNVTQRMRTQQALAAAEAERDAEHQRLVTILEQSPAAIVIAEAPGGRFLFVNPQVEAIFGHSRDWTGFHLDGSRIQPAQWPLARAIERGEVVRDEVIEVIRSDGQRITLASNASPIRDKAGNIVAGVLFFWDATETRRSAARLRESEEKFRTLANSIPQLAWMARPDGWIFWYNQRWYQYTGATPEQMEGWGWRDVHDPAELPRVIQRWTSAIAAGEPWEDTFPLRRHDGEFRWHLSRAMPVRDAEGMIILWFGTNTDVTEQRQLMESERSARAAAENASRIKDEFLATLSHELRTPLNAILGWTQVLRHTGANDMDLADGLAIIERNARAQTRLIEDLLDMSRIVSGKLRLDVQPVDPSDVMAAAIETVQPAADAREIRLQRLLDPSAGPVLGDPARLQQAVWNLLSNAIKFTPRGGRVRIVLERVGSSIEISVTDTGQGISAEFLPHVFERFRQADASTTRQHGGLGLGLAIVKHLVELHGGSVRASSPGQDRGATFTIVLPVAAVCASLPTQRDAPPAGPDGAAVTLKGVTVLAVDDEPDARTLLARVLGQCGAQVRLAASASEALDLIRESAPDVLVSDIGMPGVDGYELVRQVRSLPAGAGGRVPAIALTAFARAEDRMRALLAGYVAHLPKPVEPVELIATVAALTGRARLAP